MSAHLETLASFVPGLLLHRLGAEPASLNEPQGRRFVAAALFADISGFTYLAEQLAQQGPAGAESLSRLLNRYFGELIELVHQHGGEVVKFAGDGLLALWPGEAGQEAELALRAAHCGLAAQQRLHPYKGVEGTRLTMRVGVSVGELSFLHLGGAFQRWELLVVGEPLVRASLAEQRAEPGQVLLSPEAWVLIEGRAQGERLGGNGKGGESALVRLRAITVPPPPVAVPTLPLHLKLDEGQLQSYIPGAILHRLLAGQSSWLAELRRLTVLFINLPDLSHQTPLDQAQQTVRALQEALYRFEGSINKLTVDDKGVTLLAALGLPPLAHEDDAVRAVHAAQALQHTLVELGWRGAIGIATGIVFCGSVGHERRREYTMLGDVVNLAARLMQAATREPSDSPVPILCDTATAQAAHPRVAFTPLPPILVKGKEAPIPLYRPLEDSGPLPGAPRGALIGRMAERAQLLERAEALLQGEGALLLLEGEAGIGKSQLVDDFLQQCQGLGLHPLIGRGDAIEKRTPYHAWRPLFETLLDLATLPEGSVARQAALETWLGTLPPEMRRLAPLLSGVLAVDLPQNELTRQMEGKVRADNTSRLLLHLLKGRVRRGPLVLILEDAHWFDSASWSLLWQVAQRVRPLLLLLASRPLIQPPPEYERLCSVAHPITLAPLSEAESVALVCQCLGVRSLPQVVQRLIRDKAEGHPLFSEELAYALREAGLLRVEAGRCELAAPPTAFNEAAFPNTVQGLITSRIDRLSPPQQLTLKVASVVGRDFSLHALEAIYPVEEDRPNLASHLQTLVQLGLIQQVRVTVEPRYLFQQRITQDVVYQLMLFSQRRALHAALAGWYEQRHAGELSPYYVRLAYHWRKAGEPTQALHYLTRAGEQALYRGAYQEAVPLFEQARELVSQEALTLSPTQEGQLALGLGRAYLALGQVPESGVILGQAVAALGWPLPASSLGWTGGLAREVGTQMLIRLRATTPDKAAPATESSSALQAAQAYQELSEVYYYSNQPLKMLYATMRAVNLAEGEGLSPALAQAYTSICVAAGLGPLSQLAQAYWQRARQVAERLEDLPTQLHVLIRTSAYLIGIGQWAEVQHQAKRAIELARQLGDQTRLAEGLSVRAIMARFLGSFTEGVQLWEEVESVARGNDHLLHQTWAHVGKAQHLLRLGQLEKSRTELGHTQKLLAHNPDPSSHLLLLTLQALLHLRQGAWEEALAGADESAALLAQSPPLFFTTLESYAGVAEIYLTLWETMRQGHASLACGEAALAARAGQACRALQGFRRVFVIGDPALHRYQGWLAWQEGRPQRARRAWQQSIESAQGLAMPYDEALAHYEMARHLDPAEPARLAHLTQAITLFERLGALPALYQARKLAHHHGEQGVSNHS